MHSILHLPDTFGFNAFSSLAEFVVVVPGVVVPGVVVAALALRGALSAFYRQLDGAKHDAAASAICNLCLYRAIPAWQPTSLNPHHLRCWCRR